MILGGMLDPRLLGKILNKRFLFVKTEEVLNL